MPDIECIDLKGTARHLLDHVERKTASGPSAKRNSVSILNTEHGLDLLAIKRQFFKKVPLFIFVSKIIVKIVYM